MVDVTTVYWANRATNTINEGNCYQLLGMHNLPYIMLAIILVPNYL